MIVHRCQSHPSKAVGIHQDGLRLVLLDQNLPYQSHNEFHFLGNQRGFDPNIPPREYNIIIQPILFQNLEVSLDGTLRKALPATAWAGRIIGCHYSVKCECLGASMFKFHLATPNQQLPTSNSQPATPNQQLLNPNALFSTSSVPPSQ